MNTTPKLDMILAKQREHWGNVVSEMVDGQKRTHWCWYFLPNVPGLGASEQAKLFSVTPEEFIFFMGNKEYAGNIDALLFLVDNAYKKHRDITFVMGNNPVDVLKFNSFLTMYRLAYLHYTIFVPSETLRSILRVEPEFFSGERCERTIKVCHNSYCSNVN